MKLNPTKDDLALVEAATNGDIEQARKLIDKGADPDPWYPICQFLTPLRQATHNGHTKMIEFLVEEKKVNIDGISRANNVDWTALATAAQHGNIDMVKLLLEKGAKIDGTPNSDGLILQHHPLMDSIGHDHEDIAKLLII